MRFWNAKDDYLGLRWRRTAPLEAKTRFWVWYAIFALEVLVSPRSSCKKIMRPDPIRIEGPFQHAW